MTGKSAKMPATEKHAFEYVKQNFLRGGPVRDWFLKTPERAANFRLICQKYFCKGYNLDNKSGFLLRTPCVADGYTEPPSNTVLDIVFTKPSDLHYHTDAGELIYAKSGKGYLYLYNKDTLKFVKHKLDATVSDAVKFIPADIFHCFETSDCDPLEIRLVGTGLTGKIRDENEITLKRFDKWDGARLVDEGL